LEDLFIFDIRQIQYVMKKLIVLTITSLISTLALAQTTPLFIKQEGNKLFLSHHVAAKENWYSIGRIYNISPKEIAPFNGTSLETGLSIGQSLKIPLLSNNFLQNGSPGDDEVLVPLYHTVKEKEGLYRISQLYNKVPVEQLKAWNKLTSTELSNGKNLIVGYLKVKKEQSPLAKAGQTKMDNSIAKKETTVPKQETNTPTKENKDETIPTGTPTPVSTKVTENKVEGQVAKKTEAKTIVSGGTSADNTGGAFKNLFNEQTRTGSNATRSGQASIFKSTSGWKDAKYYALMNNVTAGTIVKVTNLDNNRSVYAKVLGELPAGKENEGLVIRISNAAASELQVMEGRFAVELSWMK
jgi:LysM domain